MMNDPAFIFQPFNTLFFVVTLVFLLLLLVASLLLKKKPMKTRKTVLVIACLLTLLGFFVYKYALWKDQEYNILTADMGGFNWWGELPFHLCNINMLLIPIAVLTDKRPLLSFSFFVGPLGAAMAILMPGNGFNGYNLFLSRMLGYFGTHYMIIIEALALASFGIYRPKFKDLPRTVAALFIIAFLVFLLNLLLRFTGLHPKANYFFSVETEGNFLLEIFHRWIPLPFLYLIPSLLILCPYMALVTTGFYLADRRKHR